MLAAAHMSPGHKPNEKPKATSEVALKTGEYQMS